jgi:CTP:molybdopterin cytidylyltransferase MocA
MGMPKALVRDADGTPWLTRSVRVLRDGGCAEVVVVLGAGADEAEPLLEGLAGVSTIRSEDWSSGMGASLATGLAVLAPGVAEAALVHLVDLPDVTAEVVDRVLTTVACGTAALARASYDGTPGHPVLIGRDHWSGVVESAAGDRGARAFLAAHDVTLVECGDLATGADVDRR